jgi:putative ABC transport system permease protein
VNLEWLSGFHQRWRTLLMRRRLDRDLEDELRFHLETRAERHQQAGMNRGEAAQEARHSFGNPTFLKEECRDMWTFQRIETLWQDLRYAARTLRKSPGFSGVAILTLALGIGANTAIFSVVNALLLRPLPYKDAGQLMRFWPTGPKGARLPYSITSYPDFMDWKEQSHSFEQVEGYVARSFNLTGGDQPQRVYGLRSSAGLLTMLGITPIHGRAFLADEIQPGKDHVMLLSEGLWQSRFARDPGVLGKIVKLNDENYTVIGILPGAFKFPPDNPCNLVLPLPPDPNRGHGFINVAAHLKTGVTLAKAQVEMDTIARRLEMQYPKYNKDTGVRVMPLQESFVGSFRAALLIFLSAVGFVLLIACANVANLYLARTAGRQKEFVVRAAMGAGRFRLIRQLLTESALLGLAGGTAGLLFAYWGVKLMVVLVRTAFSTAAMDSVSIDGAVLGFTLALSLLVGMVAGLAPALGISRLDLNDTLKEGSRGVTGNQRRNRIRSTLVVAEIALALVLLIGAGLTLKSFMILERVDAGVHPENVLVMNISMGGKKYAKTQVRAPFMETVLGRIGQLPGVQSAAVVTDVPLTDNSDTMGISIQGRPDPPPKQKPIVNYNIIGPGYLRTLGIPLLKGRDFSAGDTEAVPTVALINQAMAHKFWPNEDPIGARISTDGKNWASIEGVVGDVRQLGLRSEPQPEVYLSYLQDPFAWPYLSLLVQTSLDPMKQVPSIQAVIWSVDKDLPIASVSSMEEIRSGSIAQPRITALLLAIFASLALVLAAVGIYGVMAYSVTQRTHEMGLRMALGARITDVLRLVVGHGVILAGCGVVLGLAGAFALTRVLTKFLWGVRPTDPATFIAVSLLLAGVAVLASYLPARRAAKVDPMVALRYE